jgi:hypothetical protein
MYHVANPFPGLLNQNPNVLPPTAKKMIIHIFYNPFGVMIDILNGYFRFGSFSSKASNSNDQRTSGILK